MREVSYRGLTDYKVHCFNGQPKFTLVCSERYSDDGLKEDFYDMDWNLMELKRPEHGNSEFTQPRPKNYNDMISLAARLSEELAFSRIDFYEVAGSLYFGEITFYPNSGFGPFVPADWDETLGEWLKLDRCV